MEGANSRAAGRPTKLRAPRRRLPDDVDRLWINRCMAVARGQAGCVPCRCLPGDDQFQAQVGPDPILDIVTEILLIADAHVACVEPVGHCTEMELAALGRSEEHTSALQTLMRTS